LLLLSGRHVIVVLVSIWQTAALASVGSDAPGSRLPDRTLDCVLGRATNIDPSKTQTTADIIYEGRHRFKLRLPPVLKHVGPPPDPTDDPEPVDIRTRVLADPDGLMRNAAPNFQRVVDLWPDRVEMIATTPEVSANGMPLLRLIVINPIDEPRGAASLFMTTAADAGSIDMGSVYQGSCKVLFATAG
jgi:hypothetical protein